MGLGTGDWGLGTGGWGLGVGGWGLGFISQRVYERTTRYDKKLLCEVENYSFDQIIAP